MFVWVKKSRRGGVDFFSAGGWRFDEYRRDPPLVCEVDWSTVRLGTPVVLTAVTRTKFAGPRYHEREPGVFDAVFVRRDRGRPMFASTVEKAARGPACIARAALADDDRGIAELVGWVRRKRASEALVRRVIEID